MIRLLRAVAALSAAVALVALVLLIVDLGLFGGEVTPQVYAGRTPVPLMAPVAFVAAVVHGLAAAAYRRREQD